jgi:hypothetical protein
MSIKTVMTAIGVVLLGFSPAIATTAKDPISHAVASGILVMILVAIGALFSWVWKKIPTKKEDNAFRCPKCGLINPNSAEKCDCGHNLKI